MLTTLTLLVALTGVSPETLRTALQNPDTRGAALRNLPRLDALALRAARDAELGATVAGLALDAEAPFADRVRAVRGLALLRGPAEPLATLLVPNADLEAVALAREAAKALASLSRPDLLAPALQHPDPEVRARAAATGVGGATLCAALDDPWPDVRRAAAQGLGAQPVHAACLSTALGDPDPRVVAAAIPAVADADQSALAPALRRIAGNAKGALPGRAAAVLALARLGDLEPAERILATHLSKGGILPLADAAVRGFTAAGAKARLRDALGSEAPRIRVLAAEGLAHLGDVAALDTLRALRPDLPGQLRARLDRALARLAPPAPEDPAADDPE